MVKKKNKKLVIYLYLAILIIGSLFFYFYNLSGLSFQNWDEAIYTLISNHSAEQFDFSLYLNGSNWFEKPPFGFWIQSLFINLFGLSELVVRLPAGIYGLFTIIFVFLIGKKLYNEHLGFVAALLTLISPALMHEHMVRSGDLDIALALFTTMCFYFLLKAPDKKYFFYLSSLAAGLAVMFRGSSGFFCLIITGAYLLFTKTYSKYRVKDYLIYSGVFLLITVPWHLQQYLVHGRAFLDTYFLEHFFSRIAVPIQSHAGPWHYYFDYFRDTIGILFFLAIVAFGYTTYTYLIKKDKQNLLPLLWITLIIIPLIIMKTKLYWYAIVIIPPIHLLITWFIFSLIKKKQIHILIATNTFLIFLFIFFNRINFWKFEFIERVLTIITTIILSLAISHLIKNKQPLWLKTNAVFLIAFLILINTLFFFTDINFIKQTDLPESKILANELTVSAPNGTNLVIYDLWPWYNSWILPQAQVYFSNINKHQTFLINEQNLEYYIDNKDYEYFLIPQDKFDQLKNVDPKKFSFEIYYSINDKLLLKKITK